PRRRVMIPGIVLMALGGLCAVFAAFTAAGWLMNRAEPPPRPPAHSTAGGRDGTMTIGQPMTVDEEIESWEAYSEELRQARGAPWPPAPPPDVPGRHPGGRPPRPRRPPPRRCSSGRGAPGRGPRHP